MKRPRLLDLYCCQGGAGAGYAAAGFEVTGVDVKRQARYPFTFAQADALEYLADHAHLFDAAHASPPCQAYSVTRHTHSNKHPDLVGPTRQALERTGLPYIIENVPGSPLLNPVTLCGAYFNRTAVGHDGTRLVLRRHRLFESNVWITPVECDCQVYRDRGFIVGGVYGHGSRDNRGKDRGGYSPRKAAATQLIGAPWMSNSGLSQSIPPAYTEHLGADLLAALEVTP